MLIINAKEKLEYRDIIKFLKSLSDDDILIIYNYDDEIIENLSSKETLVNDLFNRKELKKLLNQNISIEVFNEGALLETTIDEIYKLSTPSRVEAFLSLTGVKKDVVEEDEKIVINKQLQDTKIVAVGQLVNETITEIDSIVIGRKEVKKAIDFLNEHISKYHVLGLDEILRINLNYNSSVELNLDEWLSIEELFKRGIAK